MNRLAALYALIAATLFGLSTPAAKWLIGGADPWLLAGLFYTGSGIGLAAIRAALSRSRAKHEAPLARGDLPWLAGAIFMGGIVGPILLMVGLANTSATTASLLLTFEGMATALIAWIVFRENVDRRLVAGMVTIFAGAAVLAWPDNAELGGILGQLAIVGACFAWGIDNNLTRKVSLADPFQIAMLKGLVAGPVTLAIATGHGAAMPSAATVAFALVVGFLGYGVSLVLFVRALRDLGAARTGAYFSTGPFIGAIGAVAALGEPTSLRLGVAGILMAFGVWLHLTERHAHEHEHESSEHTHRHRHDEHHSHVHGHDDPPGEPHSHRHIHVRLRHGHAHVPDSHHQHGH